ncbi:hypothetical protein [Staphylospora marina]|uniref:hypothetical protein n=1 Tax=Staphylospora marina TaxID=2490858 RepID=UPI000F5BE8AC|nr:hypothetical protein [Staphylospora marina]
MDPFLVAVTELVFMKPKSLFTSPDAVLYHPGHFPELNRQLVDALRDKTFRYVLIPSIHNRFLDADEYEFHKPLLVELGLPENKIRPVTGEFQSVRGVVKQAFIWLQTQPVTNVLLAGKAFFCRRFHLLSSLYAPAGMKLDVLPLHDHRNISENRWFETETGRHKVMNELQSISEWIQENKDRMEQGRNRT